MSNTLTQQQIDDLKKIMEPAQEAHSKIVALLDNWPLMQRLKESGHITMTEYLCLKQAYHVTKSIHSRACFELLQAEKTEGK